MTYNDRSALSSFRKQFFTPFWNDSKTTVGRTLCGSNDGFPTVGVAERLLGKIVPKGDFSQKVNLYDNRQSYLLAKIPLFSRKSTRNFLLKHIGLLMNQKKNLLFLIFVLA